MKKYLLLHLAVIAALVSCSREQEDAEVPVLAEEDSAGTEFSPFEDGVINVFLSEEAAERLEQELGGGVYPETKSAELSEVLSNVNVLSIERLFPYAGEFEARTRAEGLHRWYTIRYDSNIPVTKAHTEFSSLPGVIICEKVMKARVSDDPIFNDPYLPNQWHYTNDGTGGTGWMAGADVNVLPVWRHYTKGSPEVIVGVIDGGIDYQHEDLNGQVLVSKSYNFVTNAEVTPHNHGTHVAGTIAAINNNGIGVSGLAGGDFAQGNPGARLLSCQVFDTSSEDGKSRSGGFEKAIKWAADHGAVICNNSWGYDPVDSQGNYDHAKAMNLQEIFNHPNEGDYGHSLKSAIDYFNKYAGLDSEGKQVGPMAGGVVFFSAGNKDVPYGPPANYSGVIAVGSIGPKGKKASYSCYGDWVDIAAPGGDEKEKMILSTVPGNGYDYMQGTSMACPHVTGVAALVISACGGPGFTRDMLVNRLIGGANKTINLTPYNIGNLVDALGAITYGEVEIPAVVDDMEHSVLSNSVTLEWSVTESDNEVPASGYLVLYGKSKAGVEASTPNNVADGVNKAVVSCSELYSGDKTGLVLKGLEFSTDYYIRVYGFDYSLNYSQPSSTYQLQTGPNSSPVVVPDTGISDIVLHSFEVKNIFFDVSDPDGHSFTVTYNPGSTADEITPIGGRYQVIINGADAPSGSYSASMVASDEYGAQTTLELKYTILENVAPVKVADMEDCFFSLPGIEKQISLENYFSDSDGETLSYSIVSSDPSVAHVVASGQSLMVTTLKYGHAVIKVKAFDAKNESVESSFKVLVRDASTSYQAYPNPVADNLYIATGEREEALSVTVASSSGNIVFKGEFTASAFSPACIELSSCAPGSYIAVFTFGGKTYKHVFVKQ